MRSRVAYFFTVCTPVALLLGCEGPQLLDPTVPDGLGVSAARTVSDMGAPTAVSAVAASGTRVDLQWTDNSAKETGFEVHRSATGEGGTFALLATTVARTTTYSDQALDL